MRIPTINRRQLKNAIKMTVLNNANIMVVGPPGCGKTEISEQVARELTDCVHVATPAVEDPTNAAGMPVYNSETNQVRFLPFKLMETLCNHDPDEDPCVVVLDDFGQAQRSVQASYMQVIQSHRVGEHEFPDNVSFIILTNDRDHQAGVSPILEPVKSRCMAIYKYELELEEWIEWAYQNNLYPTIMPYLRFKPEAFNNFRPTTEMINQPCARTWHKLSKALYAMKSLNITDESLRYATAVGAVAAYASEFIEFEKYYGKLPDIQDLIKGKALFEHNPNDPSLTYALCGALVHYANKKNVDKIIKVIEQLPEMFQVAVTRDLQNAIPDLIESDAFMDWCLRHVDIFE